MPQEIDGALLGVYCSRFLLNGKRLSVPKNDMTHGFLSKMLLGEERKVNSDLR